MCAGASDAIGAEYEAMFIREDITEMRDAKRLSFEVREKSDPSNKVRKMIVDYTEETDADVLILGSYGAKGQAQWEGKTTGKRDKLGSSAMFAVQHSRTTCVLIKNHVQFPVGMQEADQPVKYMVCSRFWLC